MDYNFARMAAIACLTSITSSFLLCFFSSSTTEIPDDIENMDYNEIIKKIFFNILGCVVSPSITDHLGRKTAINITEILFLISLICNFFKYEEVSRCVLSTVVGISQNAIPLFISEGTRHELRTVCILINNLSVSTGVFIYYIINLFLNKVSC